MLDYLSKKIFGTHSDKELKTYRPLVEKINRLEASFETLDQTQAQQKVVEFKQRVAQGESLDSLLPEAFALVRKAAQATLGQRHFDVQLLGGIALHRGMIAEMKTGEGKTLTSTLPVFLNSLTGRGVHVVTVNDYLAKRDAEWMGQIYRWLGLSVGVILHNLTDAERRVAYAADITYGTNNEYGFDFLRDNMKFNLADYVQRDHVFAIVDEVDSILVDEARTPLIISGPAEDSTELYYQINKQLSGLTRAWRVSDNPEPEAVARAQGQSAEEAKEFLKSQQEESTLVIPGDFTLEEKSRNIQLTEQGVEKMEKRLGEVVKGGNLYDFENIEVLHHVTQALKAHYVFKRDVDYVVSTGKVLIVDEFTGRLMEGRRFSDGLHQALEAKEGVKIERENQTLASITFQNYFRKYEKLAGMTGTAETEEAEFQKIYNLGVVVVPTNRALARIDLADVIYKSKAAKDRAVVNQIKELHQKGQPVLVGTVSVESSEALSAHLKKAGVPHQVLNAKYHEQEAQIIAQAGHQGAVTIATNMAGRGTDIQIKPEVAQLGGLFILGTERHESRRIDNQLRGRSGRQGDPGASRFILSLEDDLLRVFGGERIANLMTRLKVDEDEAIEHVLISRAIENSQKKVEAYNFEVRKHLLEYDDVMNRQREIIYKQRRRIIGEEGEEVFLDMIEDTCDALVHEYCNERHADQWNLDGLKAELASNFSAPIRWSTASDSPSQEELFEAVQAEVLVRLSEKKQEFGPFYSEVQRQLLLEITDTRWKDHLLSMDHLKEGIGMRGYAQKNPLTEYKREGFELFADMMERINRDAVKALFHIAVVHEPPPEIERAPQPMQMIHESPSAPVHAPRGPMPEPPKHEPARKQAVPGRNDLCYCGSGKKYKNCHMKQDHSPVE
ncbi:MAG: preprotein translocase subunit SecA [Candidatus Lambdaproteobacteria bacterium RIFOXYD1_FULL_56_27]|uniref:Protein translocase subunit SecA n=1 Tax=Candidatus Lambdaproteobacteria bacterium RIFOXYD2_FULL_56_26 TaxID=1817773 RepID=A0A1F6GQ40_9PROT|nr:MAG: preprotein translocase subunit SecA [Candidatus Lambdaproteobacteria bacterium RIFOXYD2_FULL_56_26]OGH03687.1 MAG: preprotein translocase subunit SecA [Candidatus Lambdaproteobacteria bacterium RIFOXYC1_FULL_56_13]OGH07271.1 MAG: preprotein translocase subunit SecA [Candidatus Lambdaproteobacteria bacterium RIFOXYD1_FULL_56_27]